MENDFFDTLFGFIDSDKGKEISIESKIRLMKMPIERVVRDSLLLSFLSSGDWVAKEVQTEVGRIDLLTGQFIFEFKQVKKWKEGLGQLLVYSDYYPKHQKVLYLIGLTSDSYMELIKQHCNRFDVMVFIKKIDIATLRSDLQSQTRVALRKHFDQATTNQQKLNLED